MSCQQTSIPFSHTHSFTIPNHPLPLIITANFDSGNIALVKQISNYQYRLRCLQDGTKTGHPTNSKSWFYFKVQHVPAQVTLRFTIQKVHALTSILNSKYSRCYRPVYRVKGGEWQRLKEDVMLSSSQYNDIECTMQYKSKEEDEEVQFAYCYPYQFSTLQQYLNTLTPLSQDTDIYFTKQVITYSPQKRPIHLLTITSQDQNAGSQQPFNPHLFPEQQSRPLKFKKQVILISARVHPGQTPASYAMEGVLNFLTDKQDLRAHLLRKMFVFMVVPMINVDGVSLGHFRMDIYGRNLNRFYIEPCPQKQPAIYAIRQLSNHLIAQDRLSFYFDLHAHNAKKGCFIYGNAFSSFVEQVESQIFCKLMAINHSGFEYQYCNFSQKHMNAKDRFDSLTKEGCGRVVMHKQANIIHSYSVQCGILSPNNASTTADPPNSDFTVSDRSLTESEVKEGEKLPDGSVSFTEDSYRQLGKSLLVSVLDVFDKNPYNRVYNSRYQSMQMLRRLTAFEVFHSTQRFRMFERFTFGKVKNINFLVQDLMNKKSHYRHIHNFNFQDDQQLKDVEWPRNISGLAKLRNDKIKKLKSLSECRLEEEELLNVNSIKEIKLSDVKQTTQKVKEQGETAAKKESVVSDRVKEPKIIEIDQIFQPYTKGKINQLKQMKRRQRYTSVKMEKQINKIVRQTSVASQADIQVSQLEQDGEESDSDTSAMEEVEMNRELLTMCENEKEEGMVLNKIMRNDFNEKDYQQIQERFKHKSHIDDSLKLMSLDPDERQTGGKVIQWPEKGIYRPSRRVNRTCDVYSKYKAKQATGSSTANPRPFKTREEVKEIRKLNAAEEFRRNIYDTIKQEIKEGLRRQYQRKRQRQKLQVKAVDSFRLKSGQKPKGPPNLMEAARPLKSKVKLPSLGANMYIITTSTRLVNKA